MDPAILQAPPGSIPAEVDGSLWIRYLKGARAFDQLWGKGNRCPNNKAGTRCLCDIPRDDYCKFYKGVVGLAEQIGGVTAEMVRRFD